MSDSDMEEGQRNEPKLAPMELPFGDFKPADLIGQGENWDFRDLVGQGRGTEKLLTWGDDQLKNNPNAERYEQQAGTAGKAVRAGYEALHGQHDFWGGNLEGAIDHEGHALGLVEDVIGKLVKK
jgi:hypothetical protein